VIQILKSLEQNVREREQSRKFWQVWGVTATTLGTSTAAALWAMAYAYADSDEDSYTNTTSVAMAATAVGVGGTVLKTANWYLSSRSHKEFLGQLETCLSSEDGKEISAAETKLTSNFNRIVQILKELYGGDTLAQQAQKRKSEDKLKIKGDEEDDEESPLIISAMETVDTAACAPDVINTIFDYSGDLGVESLEVLEQSYDAATASLGEIISFGVLEGAANGLSVLLSSYEVYRLVGSWHKEHPTAQKITDLVGALEKKRRAYRNTKKSIEVIDIFMKLRWQKKVSK